MSPRMSAGQTPSTKLSGIPQHLWHVCRVLGWHMRQRRERGQSSFKMQMPHLFTATACSGHSTERLATMSAHFCQAICSWLQRTETSCALTSLPAGSTLDDLLLFCCVHHPHLSLRLGKAPLAFKRSLVQIVRSSQGKETAVLYLCAKWCADV